MRIIRVLILLILFVGLVFWLSALASQRNVPLIATVFAAVLALVHIISRRYLVNMRRGSHALLGVLAGYFAIVVAAAAAECAMRGVACLSRNFVANLYFFPIISFGWLYGAVFFILLYRPRRLPQ